MKFTPSTDIKEILRKSPMRNDIPQENIELFRQNLKQFADNVRTQPNEETQKGWRRKDFQDKLPQSLPPSPRTFQPSRSKHWQRSPSKHSP